MMAVTALRLLIPATSMHETAVAFEPVQITRNNTLDAFRADLTWDADMGAIHTIKAGTRLSTLEYSELGGLRNAPGLSLFEDEDLVSPNGGANNDVTDAILGNVLACANRRIPRVRLPLECGKWKHY
jgi:hypothetical protein